MIYNLFKLIFLIILISISGPLLYAMKTDPMQKMTEAIFLPEKIIRLPDVIIKAPTPETPYECLRKNLFLEAGNQGEDGMTAVANVVMNRVHSGHYPSDVCSVIYQAQYKDGQLVKNNCQFSWYCDGKPDNIHVTKYNKSNWQLAGEVAKLALRGNLDDVVGGATHYHATYIENPKWAYELELTTVIGDHVFYK